MTGLGNRTIRALVVVAVIATVFVGLNIGGILPAAFGMLGVAMVITAGFWLIRTQVPAILLVFAAALLLSVILTRPAPKVRADELKAEEGARLSRNWQQSGAFRQDLPIVIHLVFDEMMSVGAMTNDLPDAARAREELLAFGNEHSFRTYDSVYSRFFFSSESLPNLMDPEFRGRTNRNELYLSQQDKVPNNAYFDEMARRGYRTAVFQTAHVNFCLNPNVDRCETFDSFDPGKGANVGLDPRNQRASLWQAFFRAYEPSYSSMIGRALLRRIYGLEQPVGVLGFAERYDAQRFPQWFDRFTQFAAGAPRGTHIFAHFMVPHSPYLLSEQCIVSGKFEAGYYLLKRPATEREEKRRYFYSRYFSQLGCVRNKLAEFMDAIRQSPNYRDAVIIIHGDHGSRISGGNILEDHTRRDFVDNYATYFAVRSPHVQPGLDCEFVSLTDVFRRYVSVGRTPDSKLPLPVLVESRNAGNTKVEAPMPRFGCGAAGTAAAQ